MNYPPASDLSVSGQEDFIDVVPFAKWSCEQVGYSGLVVVQLFHAGTSIVDEHSDLFMTNGSII